MSNYSEDLMSPLDVANMLLLIDKGGWAVSSAKCSTVEIAFARAEGRFFVSSDGMGYVVRPPASFPATWRDPESPRTGDTGGSNGG